MIGPSNSGALQGRNSNFLDASEPSGPLSSLGCVSNKFVVAEAGVFES